MKKLLCFFGFHNWINLREEYPIPENGEEIVVNSLLKCKDCKQMKEICEGVFF